MTSDLHNSTPGEGQGAHPIWACDDEAIKTEYQRALDEAKKWQDWHARADSEAERLHWVLEQIARHTDTCTAQVNGLSQPCLHAVILVAQDALAESVQTPTPSPEQDGCTCEVDGGMGTTYVRRVPDCPVHGQPTRCPTCGSENPAKHPITNGLLGIAEPCTDPFHDPVSGHSSTRKQGA